MQLDKELAGKWWIRFDRILEGRNYADKLLFLGTSVDKLVWHPREGDKATTSKDEPNLLQETGDLVCSQPFGVIQDWPDLLPPRLFISRKCVDAKKNPCRPEVILPRFEQGAKGWGWSRLADLSQLVGLSIMEIWKNYFHLANTQRYDAKEHDGCILVVSDPKKSRTLRCVSAEDRPSSKWWVPAGWAENVCQMVLRFGYVPDPKFLEIIADRLTLHQTYSETLADMSDLCPQGGT